MGFIASWGMNGRLAENQETNGVANERAVRLRGIRPLADFWIWRDIAGFLVSDGDGGFDFNDYPKGGVLFAQICASPEGAIVQKVLGLSGLYGSNGPCLFWQTWRGEMS